MNYNSFQMILGFTLFIFVSLILGGGFFIIKRCGSPFPKLTRELDKKMWMTLGLGSIFFGFYFVFVTLLSKLINSENAQSIFAFLYHYKVQAIYMGLLLFSLATLSIYIARLFIKYLYSKRKGVGKAKNKE
jgi:hypothetical protein